LRLPRLILVWLCCLQAMTCYASAEESLSTPELSYEESQAMLARTSDVVQGSDESVRAAEEHAGSLKALHSPIISIDAQELQYQKSLDLSLGGLKNQAESSASSTLSGIRTNGVPGVPADAVSAVTAQVQAALPSIFSGIPDSVDLTTRQTLFHPTITAILPLYTGGAITATERAANAAVEIAKAKRSSTLDTLQVNLVRVYFGQVLALRVFDIAKATREGFDQHLNEAQMLEAAGQISHAHVLEVQVARDAALRMLIRAEGDYRSSQDSLARLVHSEQPLMPTTDLFVSSVPLRPLDSFLDVAESEQPQLQQARAAAEVARQEVHLAHSQQLPSLYAFGEYNLNRRDELVVEPDWIVGIGIHYTLFSNVNRRKAESAAQMAQLAAEAAERQALVDIKSNIAQTYNLAETAQRQFLALDSSLGSAAEALRVQEASFREGESTASDVIDARNALGQVRTQRAAAAYEYDLALAALLLASGQTNQFVNYLHRADKQAATQ
jgi:outer membrane protein TolC